MTETVTAESHAPPPRSRRVLSAVGLVVLAASAVVGANPSGLRERLLGSATPEARPAATGRTADGGPPATAPVTVTTAPLKTVLRSQPWWQPVSVLEGRGPTRAAPFTISPDAIQWRARWTCQTGRLLVQAAGTPRPLVDAACPGDDLAYATRDGDMALRVEASGPWTLTVEQQLDLPLVEAPLPAMAAPGARQVATGSFYRIDQFGEGTARIFRLPDGAHALRLENFYVTPNVDLTIELNPLAAPRTTEQVRSVSSVEVGALDITAGSMNFLLPAGVDPSRYQSVVIWCEDLYSAYAAATLTPPA